MVELRKNKFKQLLQDKKPAVGIWNGLHHPSVAEILAGSGFDWICIDGEHVPYDILTIQTSVMALQSHQIGTIVRIPELNTTYIKQLLDIGVLNILVPMIDSVEQAQLLVQSMHYPPKGIRGVGTALARAAQWNRVDGYFETASNELCPIAQIESATAVEALDEILKVDGLDVLFIGPADLAATMGHLGNASHKEVVDTVKVCIRKINAAGKVAGFLTGSKELAKEYRDEGALMVGVGLDTLLLGKASADLAKEFKPTLSNDESSTVY